MFRKYLGILFVAVLFTAVGCQDYNGVGTLDNSCYDNSACDAGLVCDTGTCVKTIEIRSNTVVITTEEANNDLKSGSNEEVLEFVENSRTLKFKVGNVVAFQDNKNLTSGLIAKINSIDKKDGMILLNVNVVNPLEAIGETKLDIKRIVTENQNSDLFIPNIQQIEEFKNLRKDDITYNKSKEIPFEHSWKDGILKISGKINLSYLLEAMIDIKYPGTIREGLSLANYGVNEFEVKNTFKVDAEATLTVDVEKDANFQEIKADYSKTILKDFSLAKFPITLPVSAIKLKGQIDISFKLIPKAHIEGHAVVTATSNNVIKANLHYKNEKPADWDSSFQKTFDFDTDNHLEEDVRIEGDASVVLRLVPSFKIIASATIIDLATLEFGTEVDFTPIKLEGTLKQHLEIDNNEFGVDARACIRADGRLSVNPYASIDILALYSKQWNPDKEPLIKGWSWLDFMVAGGYFGHSDNGCHEGLEDKNGRCRAKEFWSVVGDKDGLKCAQLLCSTDEQCQVNSTTSKDKCIRNRCTTPEDEIINDGSYELVTIPAGSFMRGCVDGDEECKNMELPAASVEMPEYKIGKYEVTNTQYKACVDAGKCKTVEGLDATEAGNHPVTNVSWTDAYTYCIWVGKLRLPTEAEWEKAAKGSSNSVYTWGSEEPSCDYTVMESDAGNGCGTGTLANVGSKSSDSSSYGVMDMAGNASEWVSDYFNPSYYNDENSLNNPQGPTKAVSSYTYMSVKGGNYSIQRSDSFRTSRRDFLNFEKSNTTVGFRCAK